MATHFEREINAMNEFINVKDTTTIKHAESILQYFINVFKRRSPVFTKLYKGFTMAGNKLFFFFISITVYHL